MFELLAVSKAKTEVARLIVSKIYYMKKLTFTSTNALIPRFSFLRFCFLSLIDFTSYSVFGSSVDDQTGPLLKTSGFFFKSIVLDITGYLLLLNLARNFTINLYFQSCWIKSTLWYRSISLSSKMAPRLKILYYSVDLYRSKPLISPVPFNLHSIAFRDRGIVVSQSLLFSQLIKNNLSNRYGITPFILKLINYSWGQLSTNEACMGYMHEPW